MSKQMTLSEELRSWAEPYKDGGLDALLRKAADEIERLQAANAHMVGLIDGLEMIAVNDKSGCRSCQAVVNAIVTERLPAEPQVKP